MMRSPKSFVVAVRRPDGSIAVREQAWTTLWGNLGFLRWPLFRGAVVLLESLHNGFSALSFSAEQAEPPPADGKKPSKGAELGANAVLALATLMMVGLFIAAPHLLTFLVSRWVGGLSVQGFAFHVVDGVFRLAILVGYLLLLSRTQEAQKLFRYHGAEHKTIWAYEQNLPLTVENARAQTTIHPRCGTSFLFVVVCVAVLLHVALLPLLPQLSPNEWVNQLLLVAVKVPMAFPIAGIAYELQRASAKPSCPRPLLWLTAPGQWLQNVTTREPSDDELEVAIVALGRALAREQGRPASPEGVQVYPSFGAAAAA
jgi:uncharacterized protein YqhQ